MDAKIERVNNDTYLKVFQNNLFPSPVMPSNKNLMNTELNYIFDHEDYDFSTGFNIYEKLGVKHMIDTNMYCQDIIIIKI